MAQLTVRIDEDLNGHLRNLARQEGKSTSGVVRSLVERYVQDRDRGKANIVQLEGRAPPTYLAFG